VTAAGIAGTLVLAAAVLFFLRLGFWQLGRLEERRAANRSVAERLAAPPVTDLADVADTAGLFFRAAVVHGTFDSERSIVLPGRAYQGVPGVHLLTPLRLTDRAGAVLVNRGWVPSPDAATVDVRDFEVPGTVSVRGLILPFPDDAQSLVRRDSRTDPYAAVRRADPGDTVRRAGPDDAVPRADPDDTFRRVWFTVDEPALRAQFPYPLLPALLQELPTAEAGRSGRYGSLAAGRAALAGSAAGEPRYPSRLDPPPLDEGPHLGYALQWFSFAIIGVIGWLALMLRGRRAPHVVAPPLTVLAVALALGAAAPAAPAGAQLRPLDPLDWRVLDPGVLLTAEVGAGVLWQQQASLAGTRGRLLEAGTWALALRSGRVAISVGGTAVWRLADEETLRPPTPPAQPGNGRPRQDAGRAIAQTVLHVSPSNWPADVAVRFGTVLPTTSDQSGLDRDRTDFFAFIGARYRRGDLTLRTEHGVGINGTVLPDYPQSDVWAYTAGASYAHGPVSAVAELVGHQDGHAWVVRGNEDQRELRLGLDIGRLRWLRLRYIHGIADFSPAHGVTVGGGIKVGR
jgi:surfeit locus 1 family protein